MSYGHTPDGDDGLDESGNRPSGTVYGSSPSRGAAQIPVDGPPSGSSGSRSTGTTYGSGSRGTTYGSGGTTYGSSGGGSSSSGERGTTYGSGSSGGTTYGSSSARSGGTTYGSGSAGTTYGSSASGGTTYGSGVAGTTYGSSASGGTTYGSTAVGDRPAGIGPRSRAAAVEDDGLQPEFGGQPPTGAPPGAKKAKRKKILIGIGIGTVVCLLLGLGGGGVAYAATDLPDFPNVSQTTQIQYADGGTFATFATENRVEVKLSDVPKYIQNEVVSAEDQEFWDNGGVSIRGTGRAIWGLVTGNDSAGGGSTITQQYVRNALNLTRGRSYTRKVKEIILAQKLGNSMSKDDILQGYLNTIYFGRSAWGIQSAAKAYFGKDIKTLTPAEGAVLAAVIKDPTNFDPKNRLDSAKGRWTYVMDSMVKKGFMTPEDRAKQVYPESNTVLMKDTAKGTGAWRSGSTGILGYQVEQELLKIGINEQEINTGGLIVKTTISSKSQADAARISREYMKGQDSRMATAMASIDPNTGAVKAYYGGEGGYGNLDLASSKAPHPAGSSFKPYVLAAGVTDGYSIDSLWDGTSGQTFPDRKTPLKNSDGESCGPSCSLTKATVLSLNTVYWALADAVGVNTVARTAQRAGITALDGDKMDAAINKGLNAGIGLGQYSISVLDQASGYATLAANGTYRQPYFISQVTGPDGTVLWNHADHVAPESQAWSKEVGRDVSYVLEQVYDSNAKNKIGRQGAIKTGTQQYQDTTENSHAWMCGFTPQLATAVWVGSKTKDFALRDQVNGNIHVYGNGIPGSIWRDFMVAALKKQKLVNFDSPLHAGDQTGNAKTESPTPTPSDTPDSADLQTDENGNPIDPNNPDASTEVSVDPNATNNNNNNNNLFSANSSTNTNNNNNN
jgi:membrane peptidoglycan carboxypeptidase